MFSIKNLRISFDGENLVVKNVNLSIEKRKITALVGESGCGKSVTALSIMNLLSKNISKSCDQLIIDGEIKSLYSYRKKFGIIFQDAVGALNPVYTVGNLLIEIARTKLDISKTKAYELVIQKLREFSFESPKEIMRQYSFELSGGMCQRIMIIMAMLGNPDYLIADEPTTALDVTVQFQILKRIVELKNKNNTGILFITHDLGVVAEIADFVYIMKAGEIVEYNDVENIFINPKHHYTEELINSI
jgi:ABC-type dipeptide/oligopeptide/nickel transport system ATPase component